MVFYFPMFLQLLINFLTKNTVLQRKEIEMATFLPIAVGKCSYRLLASHWALLKRYKKMPESAQTKRPATKLPTTKLSATKHPRGKRPEVQNVQGKKRPAGQNVWRDKTSRGTKHPVTERPVGQNIHGDKMSAGKRKRLARKKVPFDQWEKISSNVGK